MSDVVVIDVAPPTTPTKAPQIAEVPWAPQKLMRILEHRNVQKCTFRLAPIGGYVLYRYLKNGRIDYEDSETVLPLIESIISLKENLDDHEVVAVVIYNDKHEELVSQILHRA
jgi:hypothetical protein